MKILVAFWAIPVLGMSPDLKYLLESMYTPACDSMTRLHISLVSS
jgi:hypothetical protein